MLSLMSHFFCVMIIVAVGDFLAGTGGAVAVCVVVLLVVHLVIA